MLRAMDYAIRAAESRRLRLVLNLSFGVGNEVEGQARIDGIIDSVLAAHPEVVLTVSAVRWESGASGKLGVSLPKPCGPTAHALSLKADALQAVP